MMERPEAERLQTEHLDLRPSFVGPVDWEYQSSASVASDRKSVRPSARLAWSVRRSSGPTIGEVRVSIRWVGVTNDVDQFGADLSWDICGDVDTQDLATEAVVAIASWLVGQGVAKLFVEVRPGDAAAKVVARACGLRPVPTNASGGQIQWQRLVGGPVEHELRRMAADGASPYEIADRLWFGAAREHAIRWVWHMMRAFGMPLHVAKGVSTDPETMNRELAPWVHSDVFVGDDG